jgi:amidohydrolase
LDGVDHVIALHVASEIPLGQVGLTRGPVTAAADGFKGWIRGTGGHGAYPHGGTDPVMMMAAVVQAINGIVSRRIDPMKSAVISVGIVQTGTAFNIIPNEVYIGGTIRSFDPEVREQLYVELDRAFSVAKALGGDYTLEIIRGYPAGINDATVTQWMDDVATEYLGSDKVDRLTTGMGAEDFAYMQQLVPGPMMMIGAEVGDINRPHHTPVFDIDERAMPLGAAILAETVRRYLSK